MIKIVFLRHGESIWNLENKFTGWTDVDLTNKGIEEAKTAGKTLKEEGYEFDLAYTSFLKRAQKTLNYCLSELNNKNIDKFIDWRLNERHYGSLQGFNKKEIAKEYGETKVLQWRRSFKIAPPKLSEKDKDHPKNNLKYSRINQKLLPSSESLSDVINRIEPLWQNEIIENIKLNKKLLIVAHGNSLRAISMKLNNFSEQEILNYNIPTGIPLVFELNEKLRPINSYYLGDKEAINEKIKKVANQGSLKD